MKQIINLLSAAKNTECCMLQLCHGCHDYIASVVIVLELTFVYRVCFKMIDAKKENWNLKQLKIMPRLYFKVKIYNSKTILHFLSLEMQDKFCSSFPQEWPVVQLPALPCFQEQAGKSC